MRFLALMCSPLLVIAVPRFDPTALLREVLIPADAAVGSVIYRIRASDSTFDYPIKFSILGDPTTVSIDSLNCTRFNSVCQANVILRQRLEPQRFYDFTIQASLHGTSSKINCSFRATDATTPYGEIFPGAPTLLMVSESAKRNTELGIVVAKGNKQLAKPVLLELWGSSQFGLHQRMVNDVDAQGTILLLSSLDYETRTVHHLTIFANDPWTDTKKDTRNILGWPLLVAVLDEQDTPPVFTLAPPTTMLSPSLKKGDLIFQVHAEDGDRGKPRDVRYGLVQENSPFSMYFEINQDTGELHLARPLSDLQSINFNIASTGNNLAGQPILLTVIAEEVRTNTDEPPAQSTTVQLALIPPGVKPGAPTFGAAEYTALLDENAPSGTVLNLAQASITTQPGDVVTLELINNNSTFDITPSVVEGHATFQIKVRDSSLLDYEERKSVQCIIVAKEIGSGNYTARVKLTVLLNDVNDNVPLFTQELYQGSVPENADVGTTVLRIEARDIDSEPGNKVRYIRLLGYGSEFFKLDPETGVITVTNSIGLDAEVTPNFQLTAEAADENGLGHTTSTKIQINLIDINDEPPVFEKRTYEFIVNAQKNGFTTDYPYIKAVDKDISAPNNEVHYEIINKSENVVVDEFTGLLSITRLWENPDVTVLIVRAWDGGIPRLSDESEMRIYPHEGHSRKIKFIVPGRDPDIDYIVNTLRAVTGGRVQINQVRPNNGFDKDVNVIGRDDSESSVVEATITYPKNSVIDVKNIQEILDRQYRENRENRITKESSDIQQANSGSLLWLIILFLVLAILIAILLVVCCIWERCPMYIPPKHRKIRSAEVAPTVIVKVPQEDDNKSVNKQTLENKSVQVAEWFGRREAWTPDNMDLEAESLRKHEMDRGSDRGGIKKTFVRQQQVPENDRDHYYIREGNTDILRLITRGGETQVQNQGIQQQPVILQYSAPLGAQDQAAAASGYMTESGKDILLRRFIEQQQAEASRAQQLLPNAVTRLQNEHDLLEQSLRQQNALLRQILQERERDLRLETQSLPAGTQTDQDQGTQTEPQFFKPPTRKAHSDNEQSEGSDEEIELIKYRVNKRNGRKTHKYRLKRKIKTPIQEESEIETFERPPTNEKHIIRHTRTSEMRQKRSYSESRATSSKSINKEVLREISASLESSDELKAAKNEFSDSLEDISPRSEKTTDSNRQKYLSETDLRSSGSVGNQKRSQSQTNLNDSPKEKAKTKGKRSSRYMEWYHKTNTKNPNKKNTKTTTKETVEQSVAMTTKATPRFLMETQSSSRKKQVKKRETAGPEHPLLQHSERRYEAVRPEEDGDSGIVLAKPAIAQKKSVFTIAYDGIHTNQIRTDSNSPV